MLDYPTVKFRKICIITLQTGSHFFTNDFLKHREKMKSWLLKLKWNKSRLCQKRGKLRAANHWTRFLLLWLITLNLSQWTNLFLSIETFFTWARKLKECLPLNPWFQRTVGSFKCGGKRCYACINVINVKC